MAFTSSEPTFRAPPPSIAILSSRSSIGECLYAPTRGAPAVRDGSGHAGHADPADAGPRSRPRTGHRPGHRAAVGRCAPGGTRIVVSGPPSAPEPRLDRVVLGHVREQPQGEVLPPHP